MKAVIYTHYGTPDVLQLHEVAKPTPQNHEVLVKIYATTVTPSCCMVRQGRPLWGRLILGLTKPTRPTPGIELAGEIEAVGRDVKRFKPGDQVYGFTGFKLGCYAEYICLPESSSLALKPANISYEEAAAAVDGASTALYFLRQKAQLQKGQKILINGASGSIGTFAVQLAKHFGAKVTGVCSTKNIELVKSLGADQVIDYTQEDFTKGSERYDIVFDTIGKSSFARCKPVLTNNGIYLLTVGSLFNLALMGWTALTGGKRLVSGMSVEKNEALRFIRDLIESEKLKIIIDRCYSLGQIAEAHHYVQKGHKTGNVVITVP